ncbi:hypothetical protein [Mucilaginibacter sp. FT3.2]|uniref:hypothetical protein n=1 Tax=Mucilaginibacter sp. FT3.2 TaxID=2723090 RepID=UPI001609E4DA|nr:hypothetical protein [Mucilaginibacter sp. FT3.2]MBB6233769.1 hypothetical protein [Mucilaginibacter sp. FT3.2]
MFNNSENGSCNCHRTDTGENLVKPIETVTKTAKSIPSVLMSIFIAFFPKCPLCWAVYMSMFSSIGLAQIPYMSWLLPVLIGFLLIHLYLIFSKVSQKGYLPFVISVLGFALLLSGRLLFFNQKWIAFAGMACIISSSLLNNFITTYIPITFYKKRITS